MHKRKSIVPMLLVAALIGAIVWAGVDPKKKVIVIGMDGLDPTLTERFMKEGRMPTFSLLAEKGGFRRLTSSTPPQSPVAWSNFITGHDSGYHGIFDFVVRKQKQEDSYEKGSDSPPFIPYYSTVLTSDDKFPITLGNWRIPLLPGKQTRGRKGKAFWEVLDDHGVPNVISHIPANYPPIKGKGEAISGMDTPPMDGGYGTFSYYTTTRRKKKEEVSGGTIYGIEIGSDNTVELTLKGLTNPFLSRTVEPEPESDSPGIQKKSAKPRKVPVDCEITFRVGIDPDNPTARIEIQDNVVILQEGEWSEWIPVTFDVIPYVSQVSGICRMYLQQLSSIADIRDFSLYISPIEIDPANPTLTITQPPEYLDRLYKRLGRFHTQGMPAANKAHDANVFTDEDFIRQVSLLMEERERLLDYELERFKEGFLFFYVTESDLMMHNVWRLLDEEHPSRQYAVEPDRFKDVVGQLYEQMDRTLAKVLRHVDADTTLIVMSDHGFAPLYRHVNLNSWLLEKGYIRLTIDETSPRERKKAKEFRYVDWAKTKAYALGLNGVYINLKGRELMGSVSKDEKEAVMESLSRDLLEFRDPGMPEDKYDMDSPGRKVVSSVFRADKVYHWKDGGKESESNNGPDLIVGYARGYRISGGSALGDFPEGTVTENTEGWSGDHCIDPQWVPGVFFSNKKIEIENPALTDLAGIILKEFGIDEDPDVPISPNPLLTGNPTVFSNDEIPKDPGKPELLRAVSYFTKE